MSNPSVVQYKVNEGPSTPTTQLNSLSTQFNSATTAGNALLAFFTLSDYATIHTDIGATDSQSNAFTVQGRADTSTAGGAQSVAAITAVNIAGDSTTADTIRTYLTTNGDVEDYQSAFILEIGNVTAAPIIGSAQNAQNSLASGTNNVVSGTVTVTSAQVPCLLVGIAMNTSGSGGAGSVPTPGTGMTLVSNCWSFGGSVQSAAVATQLITTAGTYQAVFNQASSVTEDTACLAVILQGTVAGGGAIAGAAKSIASAAGALLAGIMLASSPGGTSSASGSLTTAASIAPTTARAVASGTGAITVGAALSGAASAVSRSAAAFASPAITGAPLAVASAAGSLTSGIALAAAPSAVAAGQAALTTSTPSGLGFGASTSAHSLANVTSLTTTGVTTTNNSGFVVGYLSRTNVPVGGISDSFGNAYVQIGTTQTYHYSSATASFWYCAKGQGGANHSWTATSAPSGYADLSIFAQEITNSNGTGILLDQGGLNYVTSGPYVSNAITTIKAQEAILAYFAGFSASNPATLSVSGGSLTLRATVVNGATNFEGGGGLAGEIVSSIQTGLTATFAQAGYSGGDAPVFLASFYAAPVPGNTFATPASAIASASGMLSTTASVAGSSTSMASASAALVNYASVPLVAQNAYYGIGGIYDPYFWQDAVPSPGVTLYYDPTYITVYPTGEIASTANDISAVVWFNNGSGGAQGLIQLTSGEVGYASGAVSASGSLTTIPSVFGGLAGSVASGSGALTTRIALAGAAGDIATSSAPLSTGIPTVGAATSAVSATGQLSIPAALAGSAAGLSSVVGAVTLTQKLAANALTTATVTGVVSQGVRFQGPAAALASAAASLTTGLALAGPSRIVSSALGALLTNAQINASSGATASALAALTAGKLLVARPSGVVSTAGALSIGSGFAAASTSKATSAGLLMVGVGLAGTPAARATVSGVLASQGLFTAAAFVLVSADPEFAPDLTTMQSPVGMYLQDANFVIGQRYQFTPAFLSLGPAEHRVLTLDFSGDLAAGETLIGVANVSVQNSAGSDPMTTSIVAGLPSFNVGQTQVLVPLNAANGLLNNDYYIICTCATSNPQKVLDRFGLLQIRS